MRCLTDGEVQAVVDGEARESERAHAASCPACATRVEARRQDLAELSGVVPPEPIRPAFEARVRTAIAREAQGATTLRDRPTRWPRARLVSLVATATAIALFVAFVLPRLGAPTTLSASEVLGRSLQTISTVTGVEQLEYELYIPSEMPAPHRIEYLIDHDQPGRYRFSNYGPDGVLESSIGQDPAGSRRFELVRVDGRDYVIDLSAAAAPRVSLPQLIQSLVETSLTMMQAASDQRLTMADGPDGREYVVEVPPVTPRSTSAILDIHSARAVIGEQDFWIRQLEASGTFLKQPYSVSFTLIKRTVRASADVPPGEFLVVPGPGDVVLTGTSEGDPISDALRTVLRELGRVKGL